MRMPTIAAMRDVEASDELNRVLATSSPSSPCLAGRYTLPRLCQTIHETRQTITSLVSDSER
ncbi:MAG: hypothetical protein NF693_09320 [Bombella sp.]|nr:hypothetical protein [Bombella sp.]